MDPRSAQIHIIRAHTLKLQENAAEAQYACNYIEHSMKNRRKFWFCFKSITKKEQN
eukprot:c17953_g1_i1 orf=184-351(-)